MISKHFSRDEFKCSCGCGFDTVDVELVSVLEQVRREFGWPVIINSGCRCEKCNAAVGGSARSKHMKGKAADIRVNGVEADTVADYLEATYPDKYGIGRYNGRTHIDVDGGLPRRWDERS